MHGRCGRDAGEIWGKSLELDHVVPHLEIKARCRGDVGEMWARCRGDMGEIQGRCGPCSGPHRHALLPPLVAHDDRLARGDLVVDLADQPAQRRGALARAARGRDVAEIYGEL